MTRRHKTSYRRRERALVALASFALSFVATFTLVARQPNLQSSDSYYHLSIAALYASQGPVDPLENLRASTLKEGSPDGFGDKEVLYHLSLVPFLRFFGDLLGVKIAVALAAAFLAATLSFLCYRILGRWAVLLPLWIPFASTEVAWHLTEPNPEVVALSLILISLWLVACERFRWLGLLAFVFTLIHTAFHAFLGLLGLIFLFQGWVRKRWALPQILYPSLGAALGLIAHPHFPKNLEVWILETASFFHSFFQQNSAAPETGRLANITDVALLTNLGFCCGLVLLWCSTTGAGLEESADRRQLDQRLADGFTLSAVLFFGLYLLRSQFALYAMPLIALAVVFQIGSRGRRIAPWTDLPFQGHKAKTLRLPTLVALGLALLVSAPGANKQLALFHQQTSDRAPSVTQARLELSSRLGTGAKVASPVDATSIYLFYAPQALYLNALNPAYQAAAFPAIHSAQKELFSGHALDTPLVSRANLASDYIAYPNNASSTELTRRLEDDPRVESLQRQGENLFQILDRPRNLFWVDWHVVPGGTKLPPPTDTNIADWPLYPRSFEAPWASLEGFVDGNRVANGEPCVALSRRLGQGLTAQTLLELSPYGPTQLWLNNHSLARTNSTLGAYLSEGVVVGADALQLNPESAAQTSDSEPLITVLTCASGPAGKRGFYLRRLSQG